MGGIRAGFLPVGHGKTAGCGVGIGMWRTDGYPCVADRVGSGGMGGGSTRRCSPTGCEIFEGGGDVGLGGDVGGWGDAEGVVDAGDLV